jgi:hypothetical protein
MTLQQENLLSVHFAYIALLHMIKQKKNDCGGYAIMVSRRNGTTGEDAYLTTHHG